MLRGERKLKKWRRQRAGMLHGLRVQSNSTGAAEQQKKANFNLRDFKGLLENLDLIFEINSEIYRQKCPNLPLQELISGSRSPVGFCMQGFSCAKKDPLFAEFHFYFHKYSKK